MGFWHVIFGIYGGSGADETTTDPNDGWTAKSRDRHAISASRERVSITASRERVWIAKDKVTQ